MFLGALVFCKPLLTSWKCQIITLKVWARYHMIFGHFGEVMHESV